MSMMWMRMPGQTWLGTTASFFGMWIVMTAVMMLPSLIPLLWRYRQGLGAAGEARVGRHVALAGAGYFFVWTLIGAAVFPLGLALAAIETRQPTLARAIPIVGGVVVLLAGFVQLSAWKARGLVFCREASGRSRTLPTGASAAWRHGLCIGLHCAQSCAPLMTIALVIGIMDLRAMVVVTAAISVERLAPARVRAPRVIGVVAVAAGMVLIARATGVVGY